MNIKTYPHRSLFKPLFTTSLLLITIVLSTACGFHLRGNTPTSYPLHTLHLATTQPYAQFTRLLKKKLYQSHIQLVNQPQQAQMTLELIKAEAHYPSAGNYYGVESRIYTFTYDIEYKIKRPGHKAKKNRLSVARSMTIKRNEAIGSTAQLSVIIQEMEIEAAERLLSRLEALSNPRLEKNY